MTHFPPQRSEPIPPPFRCRVVGLTFAPQDYPLWVHLMDGTYQSMTPAQQEEGFTAILVRNPENPHDTNAVEVHTPSLGMIGHIPADAASHLAPMMDDGMKYVAKLWPRIDPDHQENPGVTIEIRRQT